MTKRIAVLTGGGDCPGLNSAIRWLVEAAHRDGGYEVIGLRDGWKSLVLPDLVERGFANGEGWRAEDKYLCKLTPHSVEGWERIGGTKLGSSRTNPFNPKMDLSAQVVENVKKLGIDFLVAIGGEDTLGVARQLHGMGVPVVGIPKTIDRDLPGTEYSLGFASAVQIVAEEIDRIRTTAGSHSRFFVVEAMGRHAGHLALQGGLAGGAEIILIPEVPFEISRIVHLMHEYINQGQRYGIICVAEGAYPAGMNGPVTTGKALDSSFGHVNLGGVGELIANQVSAATGWALRSVVLSHLQRGGTPNSYDRLMGMNFAFAAMDLIRDGRSGRMVAEIDGKPGSRPLEVLDEGIQTVNLEAEYDLKSYNGKGLGIIPKEGK